MRALVLLLLLSGCIGLSPTKPLMDASHEARAECAKLYPARDPKDQKYMSCVSSRSSALWQQKNEELMQRMESDSYLERAWHDM